MSNLILASSSPRRRELLTKLGADFTVCAADIDESRREDEAPASYVLRCAMQKALAVAKGRPDDIIIAADTIVVLDNQILGKPRDAAEARAMLAALSGREHVVLTAVGVVCQGRNKTLSGCERTIVWFRQLSEKDIDAYVAGGEPRDKAGGYGIQGKGALLVRKLDGDYFNVVGLPLGLLRELLMELDVDLLAGP